MKKEIKPTQKKETEIEMLARITVGGFEQIKKEISSVKEEISSVREEISSVKEEISSVKEEMNSRFNEVDSRLTNLNLELKETNRRLSSLEKKQSGTILSLDETVHRNEFNGIVRRVETLEKR